MMTFESYTNSLTDCEIHILVGSFANRIPLTFTSTALPHTPTLPPQGRIQDPSKGGSILGLQAQKGDPEGGPILGPMWAKQGGRPDPLVPWTPPPWIPPCPSTISVIHGTPIISSFLQNLQERNKGQNEKVVTHTEVEEFPFTVCKDASGDLGTFKKGGINRVSKYADSLLTEQRENPHFDIIYTFIYIHFSLA